MIGFSPTMNAMNPKAEYVMKNSRQLLEDLDDLGVIARRKDEPTIPLDQVKRRLKRHGVVRR